MMNQLSKVATMLFIIAGLHNVSFSQSKDGYELSGRIITNDELPIAKVKVSIYDQGNLVAFQITGTDGKYFFGPESMLPENYAIRVSRNDFHKNGVSTTDMLLIIKHLLGIKLIDNPYHLIASEVNNSLSLSAVDIIDLKKIILGINTEFQNSPSWKFLPADYILTMENAFSYPKEVTVEGKQIWSQDFIGIKMGDLNNTVNPN